MNSIVGMPTTNDLSYFNNMQVNPIMITIILVIIILYSILFSSLGSTEKIVTNNNKPANFLGTTMVSIFLVLMLINGFNYFFDINIITSIKDIFSKKPEIDIIVESDNIDSDIVPESKYIKQVYHIPGNNYTYNDAKAICKAYGNRLANYKEIDAALDSGADWCSYGWSQDQMALFPTQYKKWKELQKVNGHENDCGRPGINGGFIDNPNVKFGVNCFGYKPIINSTESQLMNNMPLYPKTQKEVNFNKKVNYWKTKIRDILIAPFNSKKWDMSSF